MPAPGPSNLYDRLVEIIARYSSQGIARSVLTSAAARKGMRASQLAPKDLPLLLPELERGVGLLVPSLQRARCVLELKQFVTNHSGRQATCEAVCFQVVTENHVLQARGAAREICGSLGFVMVEQTQVATVVSELARNMIMYANGGRLTLEALTGKRAGVKVVAEDSGPGIPNLDEILSGKHVSRTGMGVGLLGSKRLMDEFEITTDVGKGTRIVTSKFRRG